MSRPVRPSDRLKGDVRVAIRDAIAAKIPAARVEVAGAGGHYTIEVVSAEFDGKTMLASQRLVYAAISVPDERSTVRRCTRSTGLMTRTG